MKSIITTINAALCQTRTSCCLWRSAPSKVSRNNYCVQHVIIINTAPSLRPRYERKFKYIISPSTPLCAAQVLHAACGALRQAKCQGITVVSSILMSSSSTPLCAEQVQCRNLSTNQGINELCHHHSFHQRRSAQKCDI